MSDQGDIRLPGDNTLYTDKRPNRGLVIQADTLELELRNLEDGCKAPSYERAASWFAPAAGLAVAAWRHLSIDEYWWALGFTACACLYLGFFGQSLMQAWRHHDRRTISAQSVLSKLLNGDDSN